MSELTFLQLGLYVLQCTSKAYLGRKTNMTHRIRPTGWPFCSRTSLCCFQILSFVELSFYPVTQASYRTLNLMPTSAFPQADGPLCSRLSDLRPFLPSATFWPLLNWAASSFLAIIAHSFLSSLSTQDPTSLSTYTASPSLSLILHKRARAIF